MGYGSAMDTAGSDNAGGFVDRLWEAGRLSEAEFHAACVLHHRAFAQPGRTLEQVIQKKRPMWRPGDEPDTEAQPGGAEGRESPWRIGGRVVSLTPPRRYVVLGGDEVDGAAEADGPGDGGGVGLLANAATLSRRIETAAGERVVLGLLDVATDPRTRGRGWRLGERVVRRAFAELENAAADCFLLQTGGARRFYEKLGARAVDNCFVDRGDPDATPAPPFHEPHVMIYPASADWPTGEVDLRGPGW